MLASGAHKAAAAFRFRLVYAHQPGRWTLRVPHPSCIRSSHSHPRAAVSNQPIQPDLHLPPMSSPPPFDLEPFLPKDKSDEEAIEYLLDHPNPNDLIPHLPNLLVWLQDTNWPIFSGAIKVVLRCPKELVAPVRSILQGEDEDWIYYCLVNLIPEMPNEQQLELREDVKVLKTRAEDGWGQHWEMQETVDSLLADMAILVML